MTGRELLDVLRVMTPQPWYAPADGWLADKVIAGGTDVTMTGDARVIVSANANLPYRANLDAIVALANHAGPLADLVRAAEQLKAWQAAEQRRAADLDAALDGVITALGRVHAVGREGQPCLPPHEMLSEEQLTAAARRAADDEDAYCASRPAWLSLEDEAAGSAPTDTAARGAPPAASSPLWTAEGTPTAKLPDCPRCGNDELGARFDRVWCHSCSWRGSLTALQNTPALPAEKE